jgi:hypothetical protein
VESCCAALAHAIMRAVTMAVRKTILHLQFDEGEGTALAPARSCPGARADTKGRLRNGKRHSL